MTTILRCPVCYQGLVRQDRLYACDNRHSFDITKEGYINLLTSNQKNSKDPGDNKEMVLRRRNFLERGFYQQVSDQINTTIAADLFVSSESAQCMADIGCGEGYYLQRLKQHLSKQRQHVAGFGIDISKHAIRAAAKRNKDITFVVASAVALPFLDETLDLLLNIFAPANPAECARVLKPAGMMLVLNPGPTHLYRLREQIYTQAEQHSQDTFIERFSNAFRLVKTSRICYTMRLQSQEDIMNLLMMTPYFWNMSTEAKQRLGALSELEIEVDMLLNVLEKRDSAPHIEPQDE